MYAWRTRARDVSENVLTRGRGRGVTRSSSVIAAVIVIVLSPNRRPPRHRASLPCRTSDHVIIIRSSPCDRRRCSSSARGLQWPWPSSWPSRGRRCHPRPPQQPEDAACTPRRWTTPAAPRPTGRWTTRSVPSSSRCTSRRAAAISIGWRWASRTAVTSPAPTFASCGSTGRASPACW